MADVYLTGKRNGLRTGNCGSTVTRAVPQAASRMTRPVPLFHRGTPFGLASDATIAGSTAREPAEPERSF